MLFFVKLEISGERIGVEVRKILAQKFSDKFIKIFYDFKISDYIGKWALFLFLSETGIKLSTLSSNL